MEDKKELRWAAHIQSAALAAQEDPVTCVADMLTISRSRAGELLTAAERDGLIGSVHHPHDG
ncbi:hypothetical protein H9Y04_43775 [Streptomyces sp. TRM66268-LWL]|uniref:MarR family transcriptional regulator n=1 Tax=Streptomyces polyasparticus TaxID=2767826 RepID=A0ABR7SVM7_9ACTN|nr:hypothetical protein [Streptomyces polyasparticus]MBC9719448.1 hypothetical protein [Streptomyces polyasparticus]